VPGNPPAPPKDKRSVHDFRSEVACIASAILFSHSLGQEQ
jgi:hypothetical protein